MAHASGSRLSTQRPIRRRRLKGGGGGNDLEDDGIRVWANPAYGSFDDFKSSMLLLYIMTTGDGWEDIMFRG